MSASAASSHHSHALERDSADGYSTTIRRSIPYRGGSKTKVRPQLCRYRHRSAARATAEPAKHCTVLRCQWKRQSNGSFIVSPTDGVLLTQSVSPHVTRQSNMSSKTEHFLPRVPLDQNTPLANTQQESAADRLLTSSTAFREQRSRERREGLV